MATKNIYCITKAIKVITVTSFFQRMTLSFHYEEKASV